MMQLAHSDEEQGKQLASPKRIALSTSQLDLWFEIAIVLFVLLQFFENLLLIGTKFYLPPLYPFAFVAKYAVLVIAVLPRLVRLKLPFTRKTGMFILLVLYGVIISRQPLDRLATSLRDITFYAFVFYLAYAVRLRRRSLVLDRILKLVTFMALACIGYSTFIIVTNDGTPNSFYFYEYLVAIERWQDFNYFRNGMVRASGLFSSPIIYSNFLILPISYALARFWTGPSFSRFLLLAILLAGMAQTLTRNPPLALALAIAIYIGWRIIRSFYFILICHIGFTLMSFYGLSFLYRIGLLEPSSATRVDQAAQYLPTILSSWQGFGFGSYGAQFLSFSDLSLLTVFLTFGLIGGILYYFFAFSLIRRIVADFWLFKRLHLMPRTRLVHFMTVFLTINATVIVSINSNIFDSVVLPLFALILGLYVDRTLLMKAKSMLRPVIVNTVRSREELR